MSDQSMTLRECALQLRNMAAPLEDATETAPDGVTGHRDLGRRISQAGLALRALADRLDRK